MSDPEHEQLPLSKAVSHLLEECRMVLPGIQSLFGFQLIAVFNQGFRQELTPVEQRIHLFALGLVAISVAMVMTPAAYHRQRGPRDVSKDLISISTRFLLLSMFPLMLGISLDFYLIARIILHDPMLSLALSLFLVIVFIAFWFLLPHVHNRRELKRKRG